MAETKEIVTGAGIAEIVVERAVDLFVDIALALLGLLSDEK